MIDLSRFLRQKSDLHEFAIEVSYGSQWINLNDRESFRVDAASLANSAKTFRTIKATSPVVEGDFLIHAVPDMVTETIKIQVRGQDMVDMQDNVAAIEALFGQFHYSVRVTKNDYREVWTCQLAPNLVIEGGQVYLHNTMSMVTVQVPRYPTVSRERVSS